MMRAAAGLPRVRGIAVLLLVIATTVAAFAVRARVVESTRKTHAISLVQRVLDADTSRVPGIVAEMRDLRRWTDPALRAEFRAAADGSPRKLNASLALVPVDSGQASYLIERLLKAEPTDLLVIWNALRPQHPGVAQVVAKILNDSTADPSRRFSAACALANSESSAPSVKWTKVAPFVADRLIASVIRNPREYGTLVDTLRPIRNELTAPLTATFRNDSLPQIERTMATNLLAEYAGDQPELLTSLILDCDRTSYLILFDALKPHGARAVDLLRSALQTSAESANPAENRDRSVQRQARAAIALGRLGHAEAVWPLLVHAQDPSLRSDLLSLMEPLEFDPKIVAQKLMASSSGIDNRAPQTSASGHSSEASSRVFDAETSLRRALILALGHFPAERLAETRDPMLWKLLELYRSDPDPGIHGAAEWTLRRWKQEERVYALDAELKQETDRRDRRWYVNTDGQTFALIDGPVEFAMGSAASERERDSDEKLHPAQIAHTFAMATKEITVAQYARFTSDEPDHVVKGYERYSVDPRGPISGVSWYDAAAFCNWRSRCEGLAPCYKPNSAGKYAEGMSIATDFLERSGYRLPTEAEWEYACRAGTVTIRSFGSSTALLVDYAWITQSALERTWPGGQLQPNDFGLFDMYGNVYDWCQDQYTQYEPGLGGAKISSDAGDLLVDNTTRRILRGGAFTCMPRFVRSADRGLEQPQTRGMSYGFRLVRSLR